jgi:hypothetical protein
MALLLFRMPHHFSLKIQPARRYVTARVDLNSHVYPKVEGHFMDGYAGFSNAQGFYGQTNPQGLKPKTDMLVVRMGFDF